MNYENLYNGLIKEAIIVPTIVLGAGIGSGVEYLREKDPEKRVRSAVKGALLGGVGTGVGLVGAGLLGRKFKLKGF